VPKGKKVNEQTPGGGDFKGFGGNWGGHHHLLFSQSLMVSAYGFTCVHFTTHVEQGPKCGNVNRMGRGAAAAVSEIGRKQVGYLREIRGPRCPLN